MKCIKAIKDGKYSKVGDIQRVSDLDAYLKTDSGYWEFVKKSEWKLLVRKPKEDINKESTENVDKPQKKKRDNNQITDAVTQKKPKKTLKKSD